MSVWPRDGSSCTSSARILLATSSLMKFSKTVSKAMSGFGATTPTLCAITSTWCMEPLLAPSSDRSFDRITLKFGSQLDGLILNRPHSQYVLCDLSAGHHPLAILISAGSRLHAMHLVSLCTEHLGAIIDSLEAP